MRVIIVGIGETGLELAKSLSEKKDHELVLVDSNEERCRQLSEQLDALVVHGDGGNPDILEKAQIKEADALVATTGVDSINTVIAMLGNLMGVEKIIVKLLNVTLQPACRHIGVTGIVTPTVSAAAEIISLLFGFNRVNFSSMASGGLQIDIVDVGGETKSRISELQVPDGAHIVALQREGHMALPRNGTRLRSGDQLLFLIEKQGILDGLRKELGPR